MPVRAPGCQATKSRWAPSPAAEKKASQSMPGARAAKASFGQGLFPFCTSPESSRPAWTRAMRRSSSKMRAAAPPGSFSPARRSTLWMWAR